MTVRMLYVPGTASLRAFIHLLGPRPPGPPGQVAAYAATQRSAATLGAKPERPSGEPTTERGRTPSPTNTAPRPTAQSRSGAVTRSLSSRKAGAGYSACSQRTVSGLQPTAREYGLSQPEPSDPPVRSSGTGSDGTSGPGGHPVGRSRGDEPTPAGVLGKSVQRCCEAKGDRASS